MRVIIAGCGRVGALLAGGLDAAGHDVAVIDRDSEAFRRLRGDFGGRRVRGVVFDRGVLQEAGVERADALVAVTNGDNSNIVVARTARERYDVPSVVARIYDPQRAEIYRRFDVTIVAAARWTAEEIRRLLPGEREEREAGSVGPGGSGPLLVELPVPAGAAGEVLGEVVPAGTASVVAVTRAGRTELPLPEQLLAGDEVLHVAVERDDLPALRERLAGLGGEEAAS